MMIVDDEPHVRSLLRNCVDWDGIGIEIIAETGSAEEALELANTMNPAIVCLDICMPVISGIEIARRIRERNPETVVVMISGHDNFSYAQQCLRIGVTDYLLKPINEEYLAEVMRGICRKLDEEEKFVPASGNVTIREIASWLNNNFAREDLSLQTVAPIFHLTSSYLSRAFKQETGENWVDYLTRLRMERAMQIAKSTDRKCYEIAQEVGFSDAKYFSACFKSFTGKTVNEFRKAR
jgi:YesN/AraC family two-component response regulator